MQDKLSSIKNVRELNISITAYRALLILSLLLEKPLTKEEIVNVLKNDFITSNSYSHDTIRVTLNTLKAVGCMISRPTSKNNYKYILLSHPFGFDLTPEQVKCLSLIRENIVKLGDWQLVLSINDLYQKIAAITKNPCYIEIINNAKPMIEINKEILKSLVEYAQNKNRLLIQYKSVEQGIQELEIIPDKIFYESDKLYLWCYLYKYDSYSYLRVDRIKAIKKSSDLAHIIKKESYKAVYSIKGDAISTFKLQDNEKIIETTPQYILIEAEVVNEFKFIQRLLLFGADFKLLNPSRLKEKLISKLESVKQGYLL